MKGQRGTHREAAPGTETTERAPTEVTETEGERREMQMAGRGAEKQGVWHGGSASRPGQPRRPPVPPEGTGLGIYWSRGAAPTDAWTPVPHPGPCGCWDMELLCCCGSAVCDCANASV